jgi:DNA-binding transcriptional LysR family regulator
VSKAIPFAAPGNGKLYCTGRTTAENSRVKGTGLNSIAAVKAGLGVTVLPNDMVPSGLHVIDGRPLPDLKDTEIALLHRDSLSVPARRLMEHVIKSLG